MDLQPADPASTRQRELLRQIAGLVHELCETGYEEAELQLAVRGFCERAGDSRKVPALTGTAPALTSLPVEVVSIVLLCCDAYTLGNLTCVSRFFRTRPREPDCLTELSVSHPARLRFGAHHATRARRAALVHLREMETLESKASHGIRLALGTDLKPSETTNLWHLFDVLASGKWRKADLADGLRSCDRASLVLLLGDRGRPLMQRMALAKALAGPLAGAGKGGNQALRKAISDAKAAKAHGPPSPIPEPHELGARAQRFLDWLGWWQ
eukprot:g2104.t1